MSLHVELTVFFSFFWKVRSLLICVYLKNCLERQLAILVVAVVEVVEMMAVEILVTRTRN